MRIEVPVEWKQAEQLIDCLRTEALNDFDATAVVETVEVIRPLRFFATPQKNGLAVIEGP